MEDIFNHSRRAERASKWLWIAKSITLGRGEFPARPDEIRRDGWKAKRLIRIHPPPPIHKNYLEVASTAAATTANREECAEMSKNFEGGGSRRRYEEDRAGGRHFSESSNLRRNGERTYAEN
jgi:hypothetical protein